MGAKLFLSHNHSDTKLANIIAEVIKRITLGQIDIWFSSDQSSRGGMKIGGVWLDEIRQQLNQSKAVIALLTSTSSNSPWILFESGFGAAHANCEIIPLCIGINPTDVTFPLAMYQCYQLGDYESLKNFVSKLLDKYEIAFDEEMVKPVLQKAISNLTDSLTPIKTNNKVEKTSELTELAENLKQHIDRRFLEITKQPDNSREKVTKQETEPFSYTIPISINFPTFKREQFLQIDNWTTVQDVFDNVYFMISSQVKAFTYLEKWILIEKTSQIRLVVREIASMIPAKLIFSPSMHWEVVRLDEPYKPSDSKVNVLNSRNSSNYSHSLSD